ncbi:lipopolysaccharide biosynthesis protein [Rosistilla oblonga]|uniref:lipopolysaccharide biosynthesis protein n=1 Tax=Rosistilla oblonga TaxID=2527990 RepID=UPI003A9839F2
MLKEAPLFCLKALCLGRVVDSVRNRVNLMDVRYQRAAWTSSMIVSSRLIAIATSFISIPLLARYLGEELFGLWMMVTNLVGFLVFADLGVGVGVQNQLIRCYAMDDKRQPSVWVANALVIMLGMATVIVASALLILPALPLDRMLSTASPETAVWIVPSLLSAALSFALGLPAMLVEYVGNAYQRGYWPHGLAVVGRLLGFVAICIGGYMKATLPVLIFLFMGLPHLVNLVGLLVLWARVPWLQPRFRTVSGEHIRQLLHVGSGMIGVRITHALAMQGPAIVVAQLHGLAVAGMFAVVQKILMIPTMVTNPILIATQGAIGEAAHKQDWKWVRHHLARLTQVASVVFLITTVIVVSVGGKGLVWLLDVDGPQPSRGLIFLLCVYAGLSTIRAGFGTLLTVVDRVFVQVVYRCAALFSAYAAILWYKPSVFYVMLAFVCMAELPQLVCTVWEAWYLMRKGQKSNSPTCNRIGDLVVADT